jgi:hypothetical protein
MIAVIDLLIHAYPADAKPMDPPAETRARVELSAEPSMNYGPFTVSVVHARGLMVFVTGLRCPDGLDCRVRIDEAQGQGYQVDVFASAPWSDPPKGMWLTTQSNDGAVRTDATSVGDVLTLPVTVRTS